MKTYLDCIPCFFEQALRAGRAATDDERALKQLLDELGRVLPDISLDSTPPETGQLVYRLVKRITGNADPFKAHKKDSTLKALALYPRMKGVIDQSDDGLLTAIRISIAGNIIDFGPTGTFDIESSLEDALQRTFAVCDYEAFSRHLARARQILYIGDNAGETVFDRLLIEQIGKPTVFAVRDRPVLNDATLEDALDAGVDTVATIVSSGTDAPGAVIHTCSPEFRRMLDESEFIIAKGQGNYEALSTYHRPVFFLLKVKCPLIADDLCAAQGDIILKGINT